MTVYRFRPTTNLGISLLSLPMCRVIRQLTSLMLIGVLLLSAPQYAHAHRCICIATARCESGKCTGHRHLAVGSHSHDRLLNAVAITPPSSSEHRSSHDSFPCCPSCPCHGSCPQCAAGAQAMTAVSYWNSVTADLMVTGVQIESFGDYDFLLCSELLRPPSV